MTRADNAFRLGVNYWPSRAALRWWHEFDLGVLVEDFGRVAAAGFDSVRVFLTWEAFQPTPEQVASEMLDRLVYAADVAAAAGLELMPTLFTGHMSGVNLVPSWAVDPSGGPSRFRVVAGTRVVPGRPRNWYRDEALVSAHARLAGACATALRGHPAVWAWDLGNENSNCAIPDNATQARDWLARVTGALRAADADVPITVGLHMEDLESNRRLGPAEAASACDFLSMHGYPIYAPWAAGPTDEGLLGFLTEITRWLGRGAAVLFSEFGLPTSTPDTHPSSSSMLVDEKTAADYTDRALTNLRAAGATGAMLWCANDYARELWDEPPFDTAPHERHFGLWHADGSPKPAVAVIAAHRGRTTIEPVTQPAWIDIDRAEFFTAEGSHLARLYARARAHRG